MRISIFGSGHVGLVQAAMLAEVGHQIICMDIDPERLQRIESGDIPFYEPGLRDLVEAGIAQKTLRFTDDAVAAVEDSEFLFICVGTPPASDGSVDLQYVMSVADSIGEHMTTRKLVITKSTVPVGTADQISNRITEILSARGKEISFEVCSNPEFCKEGSAVSDSMKPDRIIVGARSERARDDFRKMYDAVNRNHDKMIFMDQRSAELTKYAANAMLATKISFINEIANIAEAVGADIEVVRKGIGSDPRIGYQFIYPGVGYGGSCFPKDVQALSYLASQHDVAAKILPAVHATNENQKRKLFSVITSRFGANLSGHTIGIWGLSFKPNTDDIRAAPSTVLIDAILKAGGRVKAYDPKAMEACKALYGESETIEYASTKEAAIDGADCLVICTEWKVFWSPDFNGVKSRLRTPVIIDGRNLYDPVTVSQAGIEYFAIGRGLAVRSRT